MATLGHLAVAMVAGRWCLRAEPPAPGRLAAAMVALSALSLAPDADVIAFALGVPYHAPWGHRGASHSLFLAAVSGLVAAPLLASRLHRSVPLTAVIVAVVIASHGLLDAFTDGGLGVALYWPLSDQRVFMSWRPIPVAPIGPGLLSARGLTVMLTELAYFAPLFAYALWPRPARPRRPTT
ncbi:metal-dependent hydrolase [Haliangium sp.]|uniref:metal-dependent hydrolase n=1 Tax=Haliangium sp. TaxID=2663208 RepID=UPI003D0FB12C